MTAHITLRGPGEVLAAIPYQLGYHPRRCVVVVALHDRRVGVIVRTDLPPPGADPDAAAGQVLRPLSSQHVDQALVIGYEDTAGESQPLLLALLRGLEGSGVDVAEACVLRDGRLYPHGCTAACCPPEGTPLPAAHEVPAVADLVALGLAPLPDRASLDRLVEPEPGAYAPPGASGPRPPRGERARRRAGVRAWAGLLEPAAAEPRAAPASPAWSRRVETAAEALADIPVRDAVIAWLAPGLLTRDRLDPEVLALVERTLPRWGGMGSWRGAAGDPGERRRLLEVLLALCRAVPDSRPEAAAAMCTLAASVAWAGGDGALARAALGRALRLCPDYRLAVLLERLLDGGVRPWGLPVPQGRDRAG